MFDCGAQSISFQQLVLKLLLTLCLRTLDNLLVFSSPRPQNNIRTAKNKHVSSTYSIYFICLAVHIYCGTHQEEPRQVVGSKMPRRLAEMHRVHCRTIRHMCSKFASLTAGRQLQKAGMSVLSMGVTRKPLSLWTNLYQIYLYSAWLEK